VGRPRGGIHLIDERGNVVVGRDGLSEAGHRGVVRAVGAAGGEAGGDGALRRLQALGLGGQLATEGGRLLLLGREQQEPVAGHQGDGHDDHDHDAIAAGHFDAPAPAGEEAPVGARPDGEVLEPLGAGVVVAPFGVEAPAGALAGVADPPVALVGRAPESGW